MDGVMTLRSCVGGPSVGRLASSRRIGRVACPRWSVGTIINTLRVLCRGLRRSRRIRCRPVFGLAWLWRSILRVAASRAGRPEVKKFLAWAYPSRARQGQWATDAALRLGRSSIMDRSLSADSSRPGGSMSSLFCAFPLQGECVSRRARILPHSFS